MTETELNSTDPFKMLYISQFIYLLHERMELVKHILCGFQTSLLGRKD